MLKTLKKTLLAGLLLLALFSLVILFLFWTANSDYISDYNQYIEHHFDIHLPFKIEMAMVVDVDPGFIIVRLSDAEMKSMRESSFKEEGYSGWRINGERCGIGYERDYDISSHDEAILVNDKTLENANDVIGLYLDYHKNYLIFVYGVTTDTGLEISPMRARKILGIKNPNWQDK
jgi:hypothetical protein